MKTAHAESVKKQESYQIQLSKSQQETNEIKTQLEEVNSKKQELAKEVKLRDEKIQKLEEENSHLKE